MKKGRQTFGSPPTGPLNLDLLIGDTKGPCNGSLLEEEAAQSQSAVLIELIAGHTSPLILLYIQQQQHQYDK